MTEEVKTKICTKCGIEKEFSKYTSHSEGKYGLRPDCKNCVRSRSKDIYKRDIEKIKIKAKKYRESTKDYQKEYSLKYREENKDILKEKKSIYYEENKEWLNKNSREKIASNPELREKRNAYHKEWYKQNYESLKSYYVASWNKRHAKQIKATPCWTDYKKILEIYKERERISNETGIVHHVDHIIPLQGKTVCGLHVPENLRIIPAKENLSKSAKFIEDLL